MDVLRLFWAVSVVDSYFFFFFFQAEDGIRDVAVTGVQTCALPILRVRPLARAETIPSAWYTDPRFHALDRDAIDRKSTRLNSSHGYISYAVFCLKKKKKKKRARRRLLVRSARTRRWCCVGLHRVSI